MIRRFIPLALAIAMLPATAAVAAHDPSPRERAVAAAIAAWADARVKGDAAFLDRFYAPDLQIGQMGGELVDRKDDIALFAARQIKPDYIRDTDLKIQFEGNVAIVSCIENLQGSYRGTPGKLSLRMLNVLAYRDGQWRLIASQSALISSN